jgi:hypothetical protein
MIAERCGAAIRVVRHGPRIWHRADAWRGADMSGLRIQTDIKPKSCGGNGRATPTRAISNPCGGFDRRVIGDRIMSLRKLAVLPAALVALGLLVGTPSVSFAQGAPQKPAATKKTAPTDKKAKKKPAKKKAAELAASRSVG